jgi:ribonuclease HI
MKTPVAYTDGSCLGNPGPGGWGVHIRYPDDTVYEFGAAEAATTNNRMELQAVIAALEHLGQQALTICTDSRYVIDGITKWLPGWRRRGWQTAAGTPVKNRALWQRLGQLLHANIRWQHVRGHTGDPNNERVDHIARAFARGLSPRLFHGKAGSPDDPVAAATHRTSSASPAPRRAPNRSATSRYVSIVHGTVAVDADWPTCEARVRGVAGARYKKIRTPEELADFCAQHGVDVPLHGT